MGSAYSTPIAEEKFSTDDSAFQQVLSQSYFSDDYDRRPISQSYISDEDDEKSASAYASDPDNHSAGGGSHSNNGGDGSGSSRRRKGRISGSSSSRGNGGGMGGGRSSNGRSNYSNNQSHSNKYKNSNSSRSRNIHDNDRLRSVLELESKDSMVSCSKLIVFMILIIAATLVGITTHKYMLNVQRKDFEERFEGIARHILDVTKLNTKHTLDIFHDLSITMTNMAIGTNSTWPFVTIPQFESQTYRAVSGDSGSYSSSSIIALLPLVEVSKRKLWEEYTIQNQYWIQEGLNYRNINITAKPIVNYIYHIGQNNGSTVSTSTPSQETANVDGSSSSSSPEMVIVKASSPYISEYLLGDVNREEVELENDDNTNNNTTNVTATSNATAAAAASSVSSPLSYYSPIWQHSPISPNPRDVNYDAFNYTAFRPVYDAMVFSNDTVLSEILNYERMSQMKRDSGVENDSGGARSNNNVNDDVQSWPQIFLAQPIFDRHDKEARRVVGTMLGLQQWHKYFIDIGVGEEGEENDNENDEMIHGIVAVVQNTCEQAVTYELSGNGVVHFLGYGDHHDNSYDLLEESTMLTTSLLDFSSSNVQDCQYSLHLYPSSKFQNAYLGREPVAYTIAIVFAFLITALAFIMYDCFVERRQSFVLAAARRSNQIVNSLFPENVRDRLLVDSSPRGSSAMNHHQRTIAGQEQPQAPAAPTVQVVTELVTGMPKAVLHAARNPSVLIPDLRTIPNRISTVAAPFMNGGAGAPSPQGRRGSREWNDPSARLSSRGSGKPIADFFPDTSVLFADIVGFTAWSSVREPFQVFTLLESVYNAFDRIAKKLRIFKVETIGDCYVAASGLPEPRDDHAVVMCRFSRACLIRMTRIVHKLERELGPDTSDLSMRFGIHSGPVTAGVLRGEKSRFQLFGDTVNTAARMESTGMKTKIQISSETADLLTAAGKSHWVTPRETKVLAKGKGELQTYWLEVQSSRRRTKSKAPSSAGTTASDPAVVPDVQIDNEHAQDGEAGSEVEVTKAPSSSGDDSHGEPNDWDSQDNSHAEQPDWDLEADYINGDVDIPNERTKRLIQWSVDVLKNLLMRIVAMRDDEDEEFDANSDFEADYEGDDEYGEASMSGSRGSRKKSRSEPHEDPAAGNYCKGETRTTVLEEVKEIITLPSKASKYKRDPSTVVLPSTVVSQLERYVSNIAAMYRENPFHSFEHASHVTQSVTKLLARVVTPDGASYGSDMSFKQDKAELLPATQLHEYTYGITSDPLTQFACAFSALIHDTDHTGVPNAQLVKEEADIAILYKNKSVAEQNSVDLAWNLLMQPEYTDLRACIYRTPSQLDRFRQLVVNSVMATDIADRELGALRKARWEKAFSTGSNGGIGNPVDGSDEVRGKMAMDDVNRKATIVIEHLIQASDVAHTMQHWYVFVKWNERLFHEMYRAYLAGRATTDPSENWYKGEIGFFDFYIIPLAQKLKECGVFGVASDEYLTYAQANRREWELKGKEIVQGYLERFQDDTESESVLSA